jgi:hypothetical protein
MSAIESGRVPMVAVLTVICTRFSTDIKAMLACIEDEDETEMSAKFKADLSAVADIAMGIVGAVKEIKRARDDADDNHNHGL